MVEDDGFDSLMRHCDELDEKGQLANRIIPSVIVELITRLRQAEKDAARYRWLRDEACHSEWHTVGSADPEHWDEIVDEYIGEAMNASNN